MIRLRTGARAAAAIPLIAALAIGLLAGRADAQFRNASTTATPKTDQPTESKAVVPSETQSQERAQTTGERSTLATGEPVAEQTGDQTGDAARDPAGQATGTAPQAITTETTDPARAQDAAQAQASGTGAGTTETTGTGGAAGTAETADPNAAASAQPAAASGIPRLEFVEPASWIKVELIDSVTGGCFLNADEAREHAIRGIGKAGPQTSGPEERFHIVFRIRASGGRTGDGKCFGAVFFEELYPIEVFVTPGAKAQQSNWHGRLGLQKLVITDEAFDEQILGVVDDAIQLLLRKR